MIPYFEWHVIHLGPISIQVWGLFVALGILAATFVGAREAQRTGLDRERFVDFASTVLIFGLIAARLFHCAFYDPQTYLEDPLRIFRIWEGGMSMFGGFAGGIVGAWWYAGKKRLDLWAYANIAAFVLPLGCGIGRIGCFLIHDHPGTLRNNGFLTVQYPGGDRYDHGLLLSLLGFSLFGLFCFLRARAGDRYVPRYLPMFFLLYGAARFALDFFRAWDLPGADVRYFLLTPAQYGSLALVALGVWMLYNGNLWASSSKRTKTS